MRMKRINRDPERFEVINLFEMVARNRGLELTDNESEAAFLEPLSQSLDKSKSDAPRAEMVGNELIYLEYLSRPEESVPNQDFQCLGFLSDMISRHYNGLTTTDGTLIRLSPAADPGALGILIPNEYKGKQLPLWRFQCRPSS